MRAAIRASLARTGDDVAEGRTVGWADRADGGGITRDESQGSGPRHGQERESGRGRGAE